MQLRRLILQNKILTALLAGAVTGSGLGTAAVHALPQYLISQKGRAFQPGDLNINRGETVQILNDDGDLLHHAYIDGPGFSFDSGDQKPGSKTDIVFSTPGTFNVLCAIHPKMKLVVHVK